MLLSWVPAPLVVQLIVALFSADPSSSTLHAMTTIAWVCEVLVGLAGAWLAGAEALAVMKSVGWRKTPGVVWQLLLHGA